MIQLIDYVHEIKLETKNNDVWKKISKYLTIM